MPRNGLHVRPATPDDLPALVELGSQLREALLPSADGGLRPGTPAARAVLEQRLRDTLGAPARRVVLAVTEDGVPVGMAVFSVGPCNALLDAPALHVTHVVVDDRYRRSGAGRALVGAATACAEELGIDQLLVSVRPTDRESNRFFARLGFAPLTVRRAAPVATVRRRLAQTEPAGGLALRRRARRPVAVAALAGPPAAPDVRTLGPEP